MIVLPTECFAEAALRRGVVPLLEVVDSHLNILVGLMRIPGQHLDDAGRRIGSNQVGAFVLVVVRWRRDVHVAILAGAVVRSTRLGTRRCRWCFGFGEWE